MTAIALTTLFCAEIRCFVFNLLQKCFAMRQVGQGAKISTLGMVDDTLLAQFRPHVCICGICCRYCLRRITRLRQMGYANMAMVNHGIHIRLYSRAYIVCDDVNYRGSGKCSVFVNLDCGMTAQIVKMEVAKRLKAEFGDIYGAENILLSATHTHSGPAGFLEYVLFQITNLGWIQETFDAQVAGIVESIRRAHNNLSPGYMTWTRGDLLDANINRSPTAYLYNPQEERDKYEYDTDKEMFLLKIFNADDSPKGLINWFAVHGTSMNNTNQYISGDNKGYAEQMFESMMNGGALPGTGPFVAAFGSSNLGDVSPNTRGAKCIDTGLPCDADTSTCGGRVETCIASGPGNNMVESTQIIGHKQYDMAHGLFFDKSNHGVSGPVDHIHQYIDMSNQHVTFQMPEGNWVKVKTCKPAMGFSFAAGTTDGPGAFDFTQSDTSGNLFWDAIRNMIKKALTTMAGRRIRDAVAATFAEAGETVQVAIAGLSNTYSDYVTTLEEYPLPREMVQVHARHLFYVTTFEEYHKTALRRRVPPCTALHTHQAYLQKFQELASKMIQGTPVSDEAQPPDMLSRQMSFVPPVVFDAAPLGQSFGDVTQQPPANAFPGQSVAAKFISGHPRNNPMTGKSFLEVLKQQQDGSWGVVATDASWETFFKWTRTNSVLGHSEVTCTWNIPADVDPGTYKIRHMGYHKPALSFLRRVAQKVGNFFANMMGMKPIRLQTAVYYEGETSPFEIAEPWLVLRSGK
ncbi:neutral ceramidase-like [Pollicipes pollicipes]|uniref:neutral ceramidase-like n=1 Tax=Pollicipes pollicipes TaxID=41117 RepID=UPI001885056F|nr:neutral ceramidase-like [Pollicipes pollicipes]